MMGGDKVAVGGKPLQVWSSSETCLCICEAYQLVKRFAIWGEWSRGKGGSGMEVLRVCFFMYSGNQTEEVVCADLYAG